MKEGKVEVVWKVESEFAENHNKKQDIIGESELQLKNNLSHELDVADFQTAAVLEINPDCNELALALPSQATVIQEEIKSSDVTSLSLV